MFQLCSWWQNTPVITFGIIRGSYAKGTYGIAGIQILLIFCQYLLGPHLFEGVICRENNSSLWLETVIKISRIRFRTKIVTIFIYKKEWLSFLLFISYYFIVIYYYYILSSGLDLYNILLGRTLHSNYFKVNFILRNEYTFILNCSVF